MKHYELEPRYDSRNSFYGKARVTEDEKGKITLISYTTEVCTIENGKATVNGWYSVTTARHINEFLKQNGFEPMNKAELQKAGSETAIKLLANGEAQLLEEATQ